MERNLQYIYFHAFENGVELIKDHSRWFRFDNQERFHQALDKKHRMRLIMTSLSIRVEK